MAHAPDYQLTYIEGLIQYLATRALYITPAEILDALWLLDSRGVRDSDAETALQAFLHRLTPFTQGHLTPAIFPGWKTVAESIPVDNVAAARIYGMDSVRVAAVIRHNYR